MTKTDRHFTGPMVEKFERTLYGASRGQLRLALLQETIKREIPFSREPILDAGGGLGIMAQWAAERGHDVTLVEPAADMLQAARQRVEASSVVCLQGDLQALETLALGPWPRIFCHAVLEWLADPKEGLQALFDQLQPGGWLSLMVFNKDALCFSNIVKGNLKRVLKGGLEGKGEGTRLTPISPMTHDDIVQWTAELGLEIKGVTGIRVFHDYLREKNPPENDLEMLRQLEFEYCRKEPYWRLGRYLHYTLYRPLGLSLS